MLSIIVATIIGTILGSFVTVFVGTRVALRIVREDGGISLPELRKLQCILQTRVTEISDIADWLYINCGNLKEHGDLALTETQKIVSLEQRLVNLLDKAATANYYEMVSQDMGKWITLVGETVAQRLQSVIATRSMDVKNEYILLSGDSQDMTFDIQLRMDRIMDAHLYEAMINALASLDVKGSIPRGYQEKRVWFTQQLDAKKVETFIDDLGVEATKVAWRGAVGVKRRVPTLA